MIKAKGILVFEQKAEQECSSGSRLNVNGMNALRLSVKKYFIDY